MKANLKLDRNMRFIGTNSAGMETYFDSHPTVGGEDTAATPMEVVLQSIAACSAMDVVSILRKKRKTIKSFSIDIQASRVDEHPKIFKEVQLVYKLESPDAGLKDLERAVELSQTRYCGVSAIVKLSGADLSYECKLN